MTGDGESFVERLSFTDLDGVGERWAAVSADELRVRLQLLDSQGVDLRPYEASRLAAALAEAAWRTHRPAGNALTQVEFAQMLDLIRRHADTEMDQWEAWSLPAQYGRVFVTITFGGAPNDVYTKLDHLLPPLEDGTDPTPSD